MSDQPKTADMLQRHAGDITLLETPTGRRHAASWSEAEALVTKGRAPDLATEPDALVDLVNQRLFYGRMPGALRQALLKAAGPSYDQSQRVETVLYLAALSGEYAVQR